MQPIEIIFAIWQGTLWLSMGIIHVFVWGRFHRRLEKHLKLAHEERYRQLVSNNPWVPALVDILKLDHYAWSYTDDEDPVLRDLKKRTRTAQAIVISLFLLSFVSFLLFGIFAPNG
jgi:hypothetical protein